MRRPSPLPPPPARDEREPDADFEVVLAPPRLDPAEPGTSPDPRPAADADGATAPILPLTSEPRRDEDDDTGDLEESQDDAARGRLDGPLRARDVWAAARARRRALRAEVRRFTARQRRRRTVWIVSLSAIVLLILGSIGAAYSPLFGVERVRVVGTSALSADVVEEALSAQRGRPLPLVDSSEVKAALVAFPLVESYTLEARPPHELVVRIVERTPIGTVESAAGYTLVDAAGVALSTTPEPPGDHPEITVPGGVTSKAFASLGTVYRSLPEDIRVQVTAMSATTPNDVTLTLGGTDTDVVWGDASESARKAFVLDAIMRSQPPSEVSLYDVSSPGAVVVR